MIFGSCVVFLGLFLELCVKDGKCCYISLVEPPKGMILTEDCRVLGFEDVCL